MLRLGVALLYLVISFTKLKQRQVSALTVVIVSDGFQT